MLRLGAPLGWADKKPTPSPGRLAFDALKIA